jgi:hypothetical protein
LVVTAFGIIARIWFKEFPKYDNFDFSTVFTSIDMALWTLTTNTVPDLPIQTFKTDPWTMVYFGAMGIFGTILLLNIFVSFVYYNYKALYDANLTGKEKLREQGVISDFSRRLNEERARFKADRASGFLHQQVRDQAHQEIIDSGDSPMVDRRTTAEIVSKARLSGFYKVFLHKWYEVFTGIISFCSLSMMLYCNAEYPRQTRTPFWPMGIQLILHGILLLDWSIYYYAFSITLASVGDHL